MEKELKEKMEKEQNEKLKKELDFLLKIVCENQKLKRDDVLSKSRKRELFVARAVFFKLAIKIKGTTYSNLARYSYRTHATVIKALKSFDNDFSTNADFRYNFSLLKQKYNDKTKNIS